MSTHRYCCCSHNFQPVGLLFPTQEALRSVGPGSCQVSPLPFVGDHVGVIFHFLLSCPIVAGRMHLSIVQGLMDFLSPNLVEDILYAFLLLLLLLICFVFGGGCLIWFAWLSGCREMKILNCHHDHVIFELHS